LHCLAQGLISISSHSSPCAVMLAPVIDGIHQGSVVEICGLTERSYDGVLSPELNGQIGQLVYYEDGLFGIAMLDTGDYVRIDPQFVRAYTESEQAEKRFDMVLGPRTKRQVLGETMTSSLITKGFCVLKMIQEAGELESCFKNLKDLEAQNLFGRLPQEVEEGHLGKSGRAKTMWLDPENTDLPLHELLWSNDGNMTSIAETLVPFTTDALGCDIGERTAAMVCMSMSDEDEEAYSRPKADDQKILEYYNTWARGKIRIVHFMGPHAGEVTLSPKEDAAIQGLQEEYTICASPNTILLMREDTFHYAYDEPDGGEASWMQCFLLEPRPEWALENFQEEGLSSIFGREANGPPPPKQHLVAVTALAIQAAGNMVSTPKEWCAYLSGTDGQLEMPLTRFDYRPYYSTDDDNIAPGFTYVKHMSVLDGIDMFDNKMFDVSNSEAAALDPQNRQVLEITCLLLHHKGITKKVTNAGAIHASVSVGCDKNEWLQMPGVPTSVATNNQLAICANRVNYIYNLKGGSYVCDTACSSSLIAAHLGKLALLEQRWDPLEFHLALGTNLSMTVFSFIGGSAAHMLSPGGRCFTFNASANGYNRGDGTAGLMLNNGENDEYRYAYFRGSQMGNDGRSASMSAPNGPAQEKCIWGAVREAQMTPPESTVWECHGTGTSLGDPIEVGAVRKVQIKEKRKEPLMIASSKSNIGHLEGSAAAIAMVKCVVVVTKTKAAPTIHLRTLNPHLDHAAFDAFFCSEPNPYLYNRGHCQVSSFGVGGTNGHAIFWGEDLIMKKHTPDYRELFVKKMVIQQAQIKAEGSDPSAWTLTGPGVKANPGEKWQVVIEKDPLTGETPVRWHKVEEEEEVPQPGTYSITGNFNDWSEQLMQDGGVPGLFYCHADVTSDGQLQFRFLAEGDKKRSFGPAEENSSRRNAKMSEESANCTTFWTVSDEIGMMYRVELMVPVKGPKTVNWYREEAPEILRDEDEEQQEEEET